MPRVLVLDSFPLSCVGKRQSATRTATDVCRDWIFACLRAGHHVHVGDVLVEGFRSARACPGDLP